MDTPEENVRSTGDVIKAMGSDSDGKLGAFVGTLALSGPHGDPHYYLLISPVQRSQKQDP